MGGKSILIIGAFTTFVLFLLIGCLAQQSSRSTQNEGSLTTSTSNYQPPATCQGSSDNYCQGNTRNYDPDCKSGRWIFKTEYCEYGCENGACKKQTCPASCDDGNPCTVDACSAQTEYMCQHGSLNGPQPGCSGSASTCMNKFCISGICTTQPQVPCCGNSICETSETQQTCQNDCKSKLDVQIIGCTQSFDVMHGLGAVTNVFFTVRNIGQGDSKGIQAAAASTVEDKEHPNKRVYIGDVPFGYEVIQKLTIDTRTNNYGQILVAVSDSNGNSAQKGTNDCSTIDEKTISNLGTVIKIAGMIGA